MQRIQLSIRTLVVIVACAAVDCGVFRFGFLHPLWGGTLGFIGALGFANMLALAADRLAARHGRSAFLIGFVASGCVALVLFLAFCLTVPWSWSHQVDQLVGDALMAIPSLRLLANDVDHSPVAAGMILAIAVICFNAIVSTPLLIIALAGGLVGKLGAQRRAS